VIRKWIEVSLLIPISIIAVYDGLRIAISNRDLIEGKAAGGYVALLGLILLLLSVSLFLKSISVKKTPELNEKSGAIRVVKAFFLFAAYMFVIPYFGYLISTSLFFIVWLRGYGQYHWKYIIVGSFTLAFGLTYLWKALDVMLPTGLLAWP
jgi:hypothetical protein